MRRNTVVAVLCLSALSLSLSMATLSAIARADSPDENPAPVEKEWTLLVYLNGNNNLDSFGTLNINQMEQVGSTNSINVVVQWASLNNKKTQRIYVQKDNDPQNVTSPVVQDMGNVDMGDWNSLVDFVKWGVQNYPAKHYFIDVWDHGSGWHDIVPSRSGQVFRPFDISWDETTGHHITTAQLGQALAESAQIIGHKVDIYGSDACLMAMAEVAGEMQDSVDTFVGSQEVEPAAGWPYDTLLKRWSELTDATPQAIAQILTEEYVKSYSGGSNGTSAATFSAFDMSRFPAFEDAMSALAAKITALGPGDRVKLQGAAGHSQSFTFGDYVDLLDFLAQAQASGVDSLDVDAYSGVVEATQALVFANLDTTDYAKAKGISIWLPNSQSAYDAYAKGYQTLQFEGHTKWGEALANLVKSPTDSTRLNHVVPFLY